jgi:MFS family permease
MPRPTLPQLLSLNAYWAGLSFMWNGLHVIVLPAVLLGYVPANQKNSALGLLTFAGLMLAAVVQPLAGALSDRWRSRFGRRRPLMLIGTLIDFLFLAILGLAGGLVPLWIGYVGLQLSSNVAHGALQGLLPDRVPADQIGRASGVKSLLDMTGLVLSSLVVARLVPTEVRQPAMAVLAIAFVLAASAAATIFGTTEMSTEKSPAGSSHSATGGGSFGGPGYGFDHAATMAFRRRAQAFFETAPDGFWWVLASRFSFLLGIYGIQSFAQYFVRDRLAVANPVRATGDLLATIVLALMVFALLAGWLADRWGKRRVQAIAGIIAAVGAAILLGAGDAGRLLVGGCVLGAGIGAFMSANWALATSLAPRGAAGKYMGLTNLATAGAGAMGRLEGPVIDALNNAAPGAWRGYFFLFALGIIGPLVSVVLLARIPSRVSD